MNIWFCDTKFICFHGESCYYYFIQDDETASALAWLLGNKSIIP